MSRATVVGARAARVRSPGPVFVERLEGERGRRADHRPERPEAQRISAHRFGRLRVQAARAPAIQPKLRMSRPGDKYEREADRVAADVMRMPDTSGGHAGRRAQSDVGTAGRSHGQRLDPATRSFMESRFAHSLGEVRVHSGGLAAASAQAIGARAYTVGRDIVFGSNQYAPTTMTGRRLLAHELTHVQQQSSSTGTPDQMGITGVGATLIQRMAEDAEGPVFESDLVLMSDTEIRSRRDYFDQGIVSLTYYPQEQEARIDYEDGWSLTVDVSDVRTQPRSRLTPGHVAFNVAPEDLREPEVSSEYFLDSHSGRIMPFEINVENSPEFTALLRTARIEYDRGTLAVGEAGVQVYTKMAESGAFTGGLGGLAGRSGSIGVRTLRRGKSFVPGAERAPGPVPKTKVSAKKTPKSAAKEGKKPRNVYPDFEDIPVAQASIARNQTQRLSSQLGHTIPEDRVLEAPWIGRVRTAAGKTRSVSTSQGLLRNEHRFWTKWKEAFPEDAKLLGPGNTVTRELAEKYKWPASGPNSVVGQKLIHHHIDNGPFTVAIPKSWHDKMSAKIHAVPTIVGQP